MRETDLFASYGIGTLQAGLGDEQRKPVTTYERFLRMLTRRDGHWLWGGPMTRAGQTRFDVGNGRHLSAKRYSYEVANEVTLVGSHEVVTVTCGEQACVFPGHLEMVHRDDLLERGPREPTTREAEFRARREAALSTGFPQSESELSTI